MKKEDDLRVRWVSSTSRKQFRLCYQFLFLLGNWVRERGEKGGRGKGGKWVEMPRSGDGMVGIYRRGEKIGEGIGE